MKPFEHHNGKAMFILKAFDHEYLNLKGQKPELREVKINALFFEKKPEIGDIIVSNPFYLERLKVTEIIENRDAKKQHYPKVIDKIEYTENDLKRPEAKGVHFNHEKAYFVLRLEA